MKMGLIGFSKLAEAIPRGLIEKGAVRPVLAGTRHSDLARLLPEGTEILCTIPNTPVAVGQGIWVGSRERSVNPKCQSVFEDLFGNTGSVEYHDEKSHDITSTISGCGPAYAAMLIEALSAVGVYYDLTREEASHISAQKLAGTGSRAACGDVSPAVMKDQVCSPGGTSIKGVLALERTGPRASLHAAIEAVMSPREKA